MRSAPIGLEDVSGYPNLFKALLKEGYSEDDLKKIAGDNVLRVMERVEEVAASLQQTKKPSDVSFEDLQGKKSTEKSQ